MVQTRLHSARRFLTIALAGVAALSGCGADGVVAPKLEGGSAGRARGQQGQAASDEVVELRLDQPATASGLDILWTDLSDSRCPLGVACVWEGEARVTLEIGREEAEPQRVELTLRAGFEEVRVEAFEHTLRLLSVEPVPVDGVALDREDYRATIEILESREDEAKAFTGPMGQESKEKV